VVVVLRNTNISVFLGLSEGCVYVILFYNAVYLRNIKIPVFLGLSESCVSFVFLNQFDLNLFMITTENSSIFRLLIKEWMLLTSATFLIEKRS
jgi:hypothetical protein